MNIFPDRFVTNRYLRRDSCQDQDVEWGYAFDVHLNAFFPLFVILHGVQLLIWNSKYYFFHFSRISVTIIFWFLIIIFPVAITLVIVFPALISHPIFISTFFSNTLWAVALWYYVYITFLGYSCRLTSLLV